ncbi:hypothetical protein BDZ97DRAFT_1919264 [Flammula alnicola]|nr:hypothetical protein BDZ97DRAFT_1919264 [Flammula alnicola]
MAFLASQATCFRVLLAVLLWLQYLPASLALKGDSGCRRSICVAATVEGMQLHLTGNLDPLGWVAIGFGSKMVNTHMVILWKNDDGSTTLSQRYTSGYREPRPEPNPLESPPSLSPRNPHTPRWLINVHLPNPCQPIFTRQCDPRESLIFAYSPTRPDKDPDSRITRHEHAGYFTFDLTKEFVPPPVLAAKPHGVLYQGSNMAYKRVEKIILLHGFLVSVGFLVLAHWLSNMAAALPVITLGVLLGPAVVYNKARSEFISLMLTRLVYGIVLLFAYYAQVLLGRYIHNRRLALAKLGPITQNHPLLNIVHIFLGVSIIGLSFFQVRSGLEWWETLTGRGPITSWALPLWKAWILILPVAYFSGYALLPRQLRQEQAAAYVPVPAAASEANSQTSRLLAEEEEN